MPSATTPTAAEIARYRGGGYLLPRAPLYDDADFHALRARFDAIDRDAAATYGLASEDIDKPHFMYPDLFRWLLHPRVLDLVEALIGPDIGLFTSHFICKPPRTGRRVPWHEDSAYWATLFAPMDDICTIWLALDVATPANGCLRVIPGSHRHGASRYRPVTDRVQAVFVDEIVPEEVDVTRAVDLVLEANHCSVHHARIVHGSEPNRSDARRCGFTMRYFSTRCRFEPAAMPTSFRIYLARGRDHAGNRYAEPGERNEPWIAELLARRAMRANP